MATFGHPVPPPPALLLISVGNTRTRFALARDGQLEPSRIAENADLPALVAAVRDHIGETDDPPPALVASVNDRVADAIEQMLRESGTGPGGRGEKGGGHRVVRFGRDVPVPISHALRDASTVGQDRLLDALGAFARAKAACVVVDAGTAITVDFVDGEGTFQGGAIAPGLGMMLRALHEGTAALPQLALNPDLLPADPAEGGDSTGTTPFGKDTAQAMMIGVVSAARGLVHHLIDRYAVFYEAYPRVIATGGDAPLLFEGDELVEHVVPDLPLIGMVEAFARLEQLEEADEDEDME